MIEKRPCQPLTRSLYLWEIEEAHAIFGKSLYYDRVRIHECARWTNTLDRLGRFLKRMPPKEASTAVSIGNHCFFPVRLPQTPLPFSHPEHYKTGWLIHELTHVWQYQQMGWIYLIKALNAQFREKEAAYQFGSEKGLSLRRKEGWTLAHFNLEQQGDITRSYYERLCKGEDIREWQPYIEDIQRYI